MAATASSGSPAAPRTIIYIDGFNLYYGALKGGPHKWLDIERYFNLLRPHDDIRQLHYFTALVRGPSLPDQRTYLRALATLPLVNVVLGNYKAKQVKCAVAGCTHAGTRIFSTVEEKRTDVNIALQMLEDSYEDRADRLILVSGDSDLVPAVIKVKALGKEVIVYVPALGPRRGAAVELRSVADRSRILPVTLLKHSQFPASVSDGAGGFVNKPLTW